MKEEEVPEESIIYFAKGYAMMQIIGGALALLFAWGYYSIDNEVFIAAFTSIGGLMFIYTGLKRYRNRQPQIIINSKGISTAKTPFKPWSEIFGEKVSRPPKRQTGYRNSFSYNFENGSEQVLLNPLIARERMKVLVETYRQRSGVQYKETRKHRKELEDYNRDIKNRYKSDDQK